MTPSMALPGCVCIAAARASAVALPRDRQAPPMIKDMTPAQVKRLDKLLEDLSDEYGKLTEQGRSELANVDNDLLWALARLTDHYNHVPDR